MKDISKAAQLSTIYTNHSVRATTITLWSNEGVPNRHIMSIPGHRNEQSLASYNTRPSSSQLYHCSEVLSKSLDQRSANAVMLNQPESLQVGTAFQQNVLVSALDKSPTTCLKSIFSDCTIQNVHIVVPSYTGNDENKWLTCLKAMPFTNFSANIIHWKWIKKRKSPRFQTLSQGVFIDRIEIFWIISTVRQTYSW